MGIPISGNTSFVLKHGPGFPDDGDNKSDQMWTSPLFALYQWLIPAIYSTIRPMKYARSLVNGFVVVIGRGPVKTRIVFHKNYTTNGWLGLALDPCLIYDAYV